jgi:hypothetical protein
VRRPCIVLTLGSPPEKGRKKKSLVPIWVSGPRQMEKQKKNPGINPGQPAGKGREKKKPWSRSGFQNLDFQDLDRRRKKKKKPWY